jgi:hypothetical protein
MLDDVLVSSGQQPLKLHLIVPPHCQTRLHATWVNINPPDIRAHLGKCVPAGLPLHKTRLISMPMISDITCRLTSCITRGRDANFGPQVLFGLFFFCHEHRLWIIAQGVQVYGRRPTTGGKAWTFPENSKGHPFLNLSLSKY